MEAGEGGNITRSEYLALCSTLFILTKRRAEAMRQLNGIPNDDARRFSLKYRLDDFDTAIRLLESEVAEALRR